MKHESTRAARRVGLLVGTASILALAAGVGILLLVINSHSRPRAELSDRHESDRIAIDPDDLMPWLIGLAIAGALLLALIAWLAARWAARPLFEALELQKRFVADASHELRTPLTALNSRVQILQRRLARGEPVADTVDKLRHDIDVMDATLTDLLIAAEGEAHGAAEAPLAVSADRALETVGALAAERSVILDSTVPAGSTVAMPPATLTRLLVALLDNAIGHSPAGSTVRLGAQERAGTVVITVTDQGPGVNPEDRERIFERFARSAESGTRQGFGLGLALVRDAANRYGGQVKLADTSAAGSTFALTLPTVR